MIGPRFKRGDWVIYLPGVAAGDPNHEACERGTVSRVSESGDLVFVVYGEEFNAKATSPCDLLRAEDVMASGGSSRSPHAPIKEFRDYVGDGVYVGFDGFNVVLTAENGIRATDVIYLEPSVFDALSRWYERRIRPLYRKATAEG